MPSLKQALAGVVEILTDLVTPTNPNDDFSARKRMLPMMGVIPLGWVGKQYSKHDISKRDIKEKKKRKNVEDLYFVRKFEEFSNLLEKNFVISHLFVAFEEEEHSIKFGLLKFFGKKYTTIDKSKMIVFKDCEIKLKYDVPCPVYFIRSLDNFVFSILFDENLSTFHLELNGLDLKKSKIIRTSSTITQQSIDVPSKISNRVVFPLGTSTIEIDQYEFPFDKHRPKMGFFKIENDTLDLVFEKFSPKNTTFENHFHTVDIRTGENICFTILQTTNGGIQSKISLLRLEHDTETTIEIDIIPEDPKKSARMLNVFKLSGSHMLLMVKHTDIISSTHELVWLVLDLSSLTVTKVLPISFNTTDENDHQQVVNGVMTNHPSFSTCIMRPSQANSELFQLVLFCRNRKKTNDDKDVNFGEILSYFFKINGMVRKFTTPTTAFCDVNVECQH